MTLKLIDKDLKSKYAEVLYKNQVSFEKELDRRFRRLSIDYSRNFQNVENGSQVFLNRIRQKRSKWTQDDLNYRDHYKLVCRNVTNKKLENLHSALNSTMKKKKSKYGQIDPIIESKLKILNDQLNNVDAPLLNLSRPKLIPKLPTIKHLNNIDEDLYCIYSRSDREFLDHYPGKVELNITKLGKQFVLNEEVRMKTLRKQTIKNEHIQTNAIKDSRFSDLIENFSDIK
ncbi:hypothetical protein BpHYR1_030570 [Brachionus plicatilis]|uniref:Uncharacterized protein n=1 Tax=Brachionus plicatilis TaxID=10195 RepID=A0A3M7SRC0_BRAPC|nr:hypothetical protein BpHYR1_030570 [Brachionus plicatilis]